MASKGRGRVTLLTVWVFVFSVVSHSLSAIASQRKDIRHGQDLLNSDSQHGLSGDTRAERGQLDKDQNDRIDVNTDGTDCVGCGQDLLQRFAKTRKARRERQYVPLSTSDSENADGRSGTSGNLRGTDGSSSESRRTQYSTDSQDTEQRRRQVIPQDQAALPRILGIHTKIYGRDPRNGKVRVRETFFENKAHKRRHGKGRQHEKKQAHEVQKVKDNVKYASPVPENINSGDSTAQRKDSGYLSDALWSQDQADDHRQNGDTIDWWSLARQSDSVRQDERAAADFRRSYQQLMDLLNEILEGFYSDLNREKSEYNEIYNTTRFEMITDVRNALEDINEINDQVYDVVLSSTSYARSVMMKKHMSRGRSTEPQPVPETKVDKRDFQPSRGRVNLEQRMADGEKRSSDSMKMKCEQSEARVQQVNELFRLTYDHPTIRDLYSYLNITVTSINLAGRNSLELRNLAWAKSYLDLVKGEIKDANDRVGNSSSVVEKGFELLWENQDLFRKWQRSKTEVQPTSSDHSSGVQALDSLTYQRLQRLTSQAKSHTKSLQREQFTLDSILMDQITLALTEIARLSSTSSSVSEQSLASRLQKLTMEMYNSLEGLKVYIGSKVKLNSQKRCKIQQEGSGRDENDDEDALCEEDQGSGSGSDETIGLTTTDDEDFIFIEEPIVKSTSVISPWKQFGKDLSNFTHRVLQDSQRTHATAQRLEQSYEDLQQWWSKIEMDIGTIDTTLIMQKDFITEVDYQVREFQKVQDQLQRILTKLDDVSRINLEDIKRQSELVIKKTEEEHSQPKTIPPTVVERIVTSESPKIITTTESPKMVTSTERPVIVTTERAMPITTTERAVPITTTERAVPITTPERAVPITTTERPAVDTTTKRKEDVDKEEDKTDITDNLEKPGEDFDYSGLFHTGKEIMSNRDDIRLLQSMATENCGKVNSHFAHAHGNMSLLRQKVENARQMLTTLQMSIAKSGNGQIPIPIPQQMGSPSAMSSIKFCIKPKTIDGTVLMIKSNNSASYGITLDDGEMSLTVYDKEFYDYDTITLGQTLEVEKWYSVDVQRVGKSVKVTLQSQSGEMDSASKQISDMPHLQPLPYTAFVGNVPESLGISSGSWEGCFSELSVNGRALTLYRPDNDGKEPTLCNDHCVVEGKKLSMVFNGNGFVYFYRPVRERINEITFVFKTRQRIASLLTVVNRDIRFYLSIVMHNGALKVESASLSQNDVLLSLNSSLNDGQSHSLKILYREGKPYPELDGNRLAFSVERATPKILREVKEGVLVGGTVSNNRQFINEQYMPLIGCVGDISINQKILYLPDATEIYNSYLGLCNASAGHIWHSCWQWTDDSKPVSLGAVEDSDSISLFVSRDALGPLLNYVREDKFDVEISLTTDGIDVSSADSESMIVRPETNTDYFTQIAITDDGSSVKVSAWGESTEINYVGFWGRSSALGQAHTISLGQARDDSDRMFSGSLAQFAIGSRFYDLTPFRTSSLLSSCERPLEQISPLQQTEFKDYISCE